MAGSRNPEGVINAVISLLEDNLPGKLDTLDDGTFTLEDPQEYLRAPLLAYRSHPWVLVVAEDSLLPPQYRKHDQHDHNLLVQVGVRENGKYTYQGRTIGPAEAANIRMYRMMEAVELVLVDAPRLQTDGTDKANRLFIENIQYGSTVQPNDQNELYFKSSVMSMTAHTTP